jgi:uncharacterized cupin superfamily protein
MSDPDFTIVALDRDISERFGALRRELGVSAFGLNLIALQAGERGRIHAHEHQEEVFLVLEGELTLLVDAVEHVLVTDQLARIAPAVRRQLVNSGPNRLVLLAIGGSGEHIGRDGRAWSSWEESGPGKPPQEIPLPEDLPQGV